MKKKKLQINIRVEFFYFTNVWIVRQDHDIMRPFEVTESDRPAMDKALPQKTSASNSLYVYPNPFAQIQL